jgi:hypothetical protein
MATRKEIKRELLHDFIRFLLKEKTIYEDDAKTIMLQADTYAEGEIEI